MIYRVRLAVSTFIKRLIIAFLTTNFEGMKAFPSKLVVANSNLTGTLKLSEIENLDSQLQHIGDAYRLDHEGFYLQASEVRKNYLKQSYSDFQADNDYYPPLIGRSWTKFIGHLSVLALHSEAQNLGLVPKGRRYLITSEKIANKSLLELIEGDYLSLSDTYLSNLELFPPTQILFENYHAIKTVTGFQETHAFIESVFTESSKTNPSKSILSRSLAEKQVNKSSRAFLSSRLGLPYIAVHLRNSGSNERRDVNPSTYFDAFHKLIQNGFQIVNIGPEVISNSGIEIVNVPEKFLHPFIMANAEFAITSTSGPSLLPSLFGTPNLVTNLTSIGRNMINCNSSTFYLPKKVFRGNQELNYQEVLISSLAYDELESKELASKNISIVDNSSKEIEDACLWMLNSIRRKDFSIDRELELKLNSIQVKNNSVTRGRLIPTYFELNPNYLD